jgi:hypothetical protein
MALRSTAKDMPEPSMLTILIEAAAAVKNKDGYSSLHGYVENHGLTSRRVIEPLEAEVKFAVLDSIGDVLLQNHQVIAITPDKQERFVTTILVSDSDPYLEDEFGIDVQAEDPINGASRVLAISASVVPNANDRHGGDCKGGQMGGPLGNLRLVADGKSMWDDIKKDSLCHALE